jgi:HAD superfamily hydrolase (TIGR01509 family)
MVFDFDGLLCDTEGVLVRTAQDLFAAHGATLPLDRWLGVIGTHSPATFWVPWLQEQVQRPLDPDALVAEFSARNLELVAELAPNPGVTSLLESLHADRFPLAIASSSPTTWVEPLVDSLGLRAYFHEIVCREHAERAKPAPDLYLEALRRLSVDPADAVAFEDSHNGSLAAVRAGMHCIAAPSALTSVQDFGHVDAVVGSLEDVDSIDTLHRLLGR